MDILGFIQQHMSLIGYGLAAGLGGIGVSVFSRSPKTAQNALAKLASAQEKVGDAEFEIAELRDALKSELDLLK